MKFDISDGQRRAIFYIVEDDNGRYISSQTPGPVSLADFTTVVNFREQRLVSRHTGVLVTLSVLSLFYLVADLCLLMKGYE